MTRIQCFYCGMGPWWWWWWWWWWRRRWWCLFEHWWRTWLFHATTSRLQNHMKRAHHILHFYIVQLAMLNGKLAVVTIKICCTRWDCLRSRWRARGGGWWLPRGSWCARPLCRGRLCLHGAVLEIHWVWRRLMWRLHLQHCQNGQHEASRVSRTPGCPIPLQPLQLQGPGQGEPATPYKRRTSGNSVLLRFLLLLCNSKGQS